MNVVLFAGLPSSIAYVEALACAGAAPRLVVAPGSSRAAPFAAATASRWGLPFAELGDLDPPFVARVAALQPDLVLFAGWPEPVRPALRGLGRLGTLELRAGTPGAERAREPLFWAILNRQPRVLLEIRHATHELDRGPLVDAIAVPLDADATSASLAQAVDVAGATLIPAIVAAARAEAIARGEDVPRDGRRYPPLRPEHGLLDLTRPAADLERLVRAATGELLPYLFFRGVKLGVLRADVVSAPRRAAPGQVIAVDGGVAFATAAHALRIRRALFLGKSFDGETLARELGIDVGSQLSNSPAF